MLARVKEFDGDVGKLWAEYQQDIGIESGELGEFKQELNDCVAINFVFETRFEYGFACGFDCGIRQSENDALRLCEIS